MWDYEYLQEMSTGIKEIVKYGTHNAGDCEERTVFECYSQ